MLSINRKKEPKANGNYLNNKNTKETTIISITIWKLSEVNELLKILQIMNHNDKYKSYEM